MEIDRREVLAGLAAVTAAAILPAFPSAFAGRAIRAVSTGPRRFALIDGPVIADLAKPTPALWQVYYDALWHFDPGENDTGWLHGNHRAVRHAQTGLVFRHRLYPSYEAAELVAIDDPEDAWPEVAWPDDETIALIGKAAWLAMFNIPIACTRRRGPEGPVFLHWGTDSGRPLILEKAPPLVQ